jgi:hypothetical protein
MDRYRSSENLLERLGEGAGLENSAIYIQIYMDRYRSSENLLERLGEGAGLENGILSTAHLLFFGVGGTSR